MKHTQKPSMTPMAKGWEAGIVVGIDPGLDQHGVVALVAGSCYRLERRMFPNSIAGMQMLAGRLQEWQDRSQGRLAIAIEEASAYGEALECYVSQAGFQVVVVNELKVARFKDAIGADASDLDDAEAIARFVMVQPDQARTPARQAVQADTHGSVHRRLRQWSRRYERWTREHTAACNELHAVLRMAWLADYQRFFSRIDGAAALAFWQQYPTPVEVAAADDQQIAALLRQASHGRLATKTCAARARDIRETAVLMVAAFGRNDPHRWSAWAQDIRLLAGHLAYINAGRKQLEASIQEALESIGSPLPSFKGIGPILSATIHGETLSIQRFGTADQFARYNGTAPREDSSGRQPRHVKNVRCNRRLRQAFMQLALNAPRYQVASRAYEKHLEARGITGGAARIRLARRLSNIVFAMLRDNQPYDLELYMNKKKPAA